MCVKTRTLTQTNKLSPRVSPGLQVTLELGKVKVRSAALLDEVVNVVEEVDSEVEQGAGANLVVDGDVALVQVPAAGAHQEGGELAVRPRSVHLSVCGVGEAVASEASCKRKFVLLALK